MSGFVHWLIDTYLGTGVLGIQFRLIGKRTVTAALLFLAFVQVLPHLAVMFLETKGAADDPKEY